MFFCKVIPAFILSVGLATAIPHDQKSDGTLGEQAWRMFFK
jgi:hypothetical protein